MSNTSRPFSSALTTQATIQIATTHMTYYGPIFILIIGIIGCLCNFLTFTAPQLRKNSCAFYFLCSAIFELLSITFGLITRLASDHLHSNLQNTNKTYCKLRAYLVSAVPLIATYLVLLSTIDRCMSSSVHPRLRSFSQMKIAYRSVIIAIVISLITCSHILISYNLRPRCATLPGTYAIFDGMFVVFWLGVIPHVLMLVFGSLTLINIRRVRQRKLNKPQTNSSINDHQKRSDKNTNAQLIVMMIVQVGLSTILILTRMIYYAYYLLGPKLTGYDRKVGTFLMSFTTLLYYSNYAKSFYIYTLSSKLFRKIFLQRLKLYIRRIFGSKASAILTKNTDKITRMDSRQSTIESRSY